MKKWFFKLPQPVRLLLVICLYAGIFVGHTSLVMLYVRDYSIKVDSKEVVVTTRAIPLHSIIKEDDVMVKPVRLSDLIEKPIADRKLIVGKETQAPMGKNEQFNDVKINTVVKKEGEMIIEVPTDWVTSFPKSLRRLDKVSLLPVVAKNVVKSDNTNSPSQQQNGVNTSAAGTITEDPNQVLLDEAKKILSGLTVAYFKDSTANDITDSLPNTNATQENGPRTRSSNLGARLEVAMTDKQWDMMKKLSQNNYKFVISYQ